MINMLKTKISKIIKLGEGISIEFKECKSRATLPLECEICHTTFYKSKHNIQDGLNPNLKKQYNTCSRKCTSVLNGSLHYIKCKNCDTMFYKNDANFKRSDSHFCSRSCAGTQNNKHKTSGTRRSKLEKYLEEQLIKLYPNLEIHFNRKDTIGSELDIYIPSLRLGIELNGIFHYEPIFGNKKFQQIQTNDKNKTIECAKYQIDLCTIDTSSQKYFKERTSLKFLNIICDIINDR